MFPSLMFNQSEPQRMKGCDIHHHAPTAVKHASRHTIAKGNSTLFFTHLQFELLWES